MGPMFIPMWVIVTLAVVLLGPWILFGLLVLWTQASVALFPPRTRVLDPMGDAMRQESARMALTASPQTEAPHPD
jgi:hypothetical protein